MWLAIVFSLLVLPVVAAVWVVLPPRFVHAWQTSVVTFAVLALLALAFDGAYLWSLGFKLLMLPVPFVLFALFFRNLPPLGKE